jgi:D-beta-D-heptose 7-phosphate kinase/D-beta-D-heptose 1-phosphate adenosyltransferase
LLKRYCGRWAALNGCFDCLHGGHVALLRLARSFGPVLALINSDENVARRKPGRPIQPAADRAAALRPYADLVLPFSSEDQLYELLRLARPYCLVKGDDYRGKEITGLEFARFVVFLPRADISTSLMLSRGIIF